MIKQIITKKRLLIPLLTFISLSCVLGQNKIFGDDPVWTEYMIYGTAKNQIIEKFQTKTSGDTIIRGINYRKLVQYDPTTNDYTYYAGGFREENGKVYANINSGLPIYASDFLLYDFTANVGDTIKYNFYIFQTNLYSIVTKIDSVTLLTGKKRKRFYFNNLPECIEGIGSVRGFFFPGNTSTPMYLSCFKQNDTEYYINSQWCPDGSCCDISTSIPQIRSSTKRTVLSPTITENFSKLILTSTNIPCKSVIITNFLGKQLKSILCPDNNTDFPVNLSDLPSGIYFIQAKFSDRTEVHKIIKL